MSALNESLVEAAALMWFGELGYAVWHGPRLTPGEPSTEQGAFDQVFLVGRLREAIRRLNPVIRSRTLGALPDTLLPRLQRGGLPLGRPAASR